MTPELYATAAETAALWRKRRTYDRDRARTGDMITVNLASFVQMAPRSPRRASNRAVASDSRLRPDDEGASVADVQRKDSLLIGILTSIRGMLAALRESR